MPFVEKTKRKHGDRVDGHWVRDAGGMNVIMTGLYPNRADCEICSFNELDVTELLKFIKKHNDENPDKKIGFFHCMIAALVRLTNDRRKLNRFVRHGRIYERDEITVSFVAKREFADAGGRVIVTYKAKKDDNVESVAEYIKGEVTGVRKETTASKETRKKSKNITQSLDAYAKWPRWFLLLVTRLMRMLDAYGKVPKKIRQGDPAFTSILIANLGSIKADSIYHHLNNYGTNSMMITVGTLHQKEVTNEDGTKEVRDFVDMSLNADERIADGFYFIHSMRILEKYLQNPDKLMLKFDEDVVFED